MDKANKIALVPRSDFSLLSANPNLVYLDSAATAQKPRAVLDAMNDFYETDYANPHRGAYALSARATERYARARGAVARFFGVRDEACVIFTRGTTDSLNVVAGAWGRANLSAGDEVIVTGAEHHANFVPWQQIAIERGATFTICPLTADGSADMEALATLVSRKTKVIAFNHVSNVLGAINPVSEIVTIAKSVGALTVCDGAQGAPHMSVGFDALRRRLLRGERAQDARADGHGCADRPTRGTRGDAAVPDGRRHDRVRGRRGTTWNVLPHRLEAGTPNVAGAVGLAAACDYLTAIGMDAVASHERALVRLAYERVSAIEDVRVHGPGATERSGVLSFTVGDIHPHDLATLLDERHICIRAGHHCAQPLMRRLGVAATARASFYVYNDESDVEMLVEAMESAKRVFAVA